MTTVAFVSYKFQGQDRRLGPMAEEHAGPLAKDYARRHGVTDVTIEAWACVRVIPVSKPA